MVEFIIITVLAMGCVVSSTFREECFKPVFSTGRVMTYVLGFEAIRMIPFKSMDTIETVAVSVLALVVFTVALVAVERAEQYWWESATKR